MFTVGSQGASITCLRRCQRQASGTQCVGRRSIQARVRRCALCPLLALCPAVAGTKLAAQAASSTTDSAGISGVVHTPTGARAAGVAVELIGTRYHATTDTNGAFALRVAPGAYTLMAHGPPWLTARIPIRIAGGRDTAVDVVLAPARDGSAARAAVPTLAPVHVQGASTARAAAGPGMSPAGANTYTVTAASIESLPTGDNAPLTDVLAQMPGVAIDQNQQIHIRNTEGPQFQYRIDGALVPLDINTNPPFVTMINPMFVASMDLLDGVLPSRYSYATGGVVDIETKNGCSNRGGQLSAFFGQRGTLQPSVQYAGCSGKVSYYVSALYDQGQTAFSSATPGPSPIHDQTQQGQGFGYLSIPLNGATKLIAILSTAASNNQLPNVPDLAPAFTLAGVDSANSASIDSYLNFRDALGLVTLSGKPTSDLTYQITYAAHAISQHFVPDAAGELIFQGVASTASHDDVDHTLQADVTYQVGRHLLSTGVYLGDYHVVADDPSLVFPVDTAGTQTSSAPVTIVNNTSATNILSGVYVNDLWTISDRWRLNVGVRWDDITGFTRNNQVDPTINLTYALTPQTSLHGGVARYFQVPSFLGISPTASTAFAGTTAAGPPGVSTPLTEDDVEWDAGIVHHLRHGITLSQDAFYEVTHHYLDTGQFGVVPIFAPFNYDRGTIWGTESAITYRDHQLSAYGNVTIGRNLQRGVVTGQFNFDPDELAYINAHSIVLDHQPLYGASAGAADTWRQLTFTVDGVYSSGLRGGFADLVQLPTVLQINAGVQHGFSLPLLGRVTDRLTVLNLLDRVNLIRPAEGIGILQSAYGPRFTVLDTFSIPF